MNLKKFVKVRNEAFTKFVMDDDWDAILKYAKKYRLEMPADIRIAKAGIYKAVQEITDIPNEVKAEAARKCCLMGFRPTMHY